MTREITDLRVRIPGARLQVRVSGAGQPVLLLHGGGPGTSSWDWFDCMRAIPDGAQCYAMDFPGFGGSTPFEDGQPYGTDSFVAAAVALIDSLCLAPVVLVGHSMGSGVAATLAMQRPDLIKHLVLVAPGGGLYGINDYASPGMQQIKRTLEDPSEEQVRALVAVMCAQTAGQDAQVARRLRILANPQVMAVQRRMQGQRSAATPDDAARRAAQGERMREHAGPVTLVWGGSERFNPVELGERILARLPGHTAYRLVADAGHNVHCDQPQAMARILGEAAA